MFSKILAISENTFKEAIRNKTLYTIVAFGIFIVIFSLIAGELSVGEEIKVIKDIGLSSILLLGVFVSIFIGISLFYKEIDKRTIYTLVSKPIPRYVLIIGKFLGISFTLLLQTLLMFLILEGVIFIAAGSPDFSLILAVFFIYLEILLIISFALFFSSFSTPFLSGIFSFFTYIIAHLVDELIFYAEKSKNLYFDLLAKLLKVAIPNLEYFNLRGRIVHGLFIETGEIVTAVCYCLLWLIFILGIGSLIFSRRDFK